MKPVVAPLLAALLLAGCATAPLGEAKLALAETVFTEIARTGQWNGHVIRGPWDIDDKITDQPEPTACHRDLSFIDAPVREMSPELVAWRRADPDSRDIVGFALSPRIIEALIAQRVAETPALLRTPEYRAKFVEEMKTKFTEEFETRYPGEIAAHGGFDKVIEALGGVDKLIDTITAAPEFQPKLAESIAAEWGRQLGFDSGLIPAIYIDPALTARDMPHTRAWILHHERCHWLTGWAHQGDGKGAANRTPRDINGKILP